MFTDVLVIDEVGLPMQSIRDRLSTDSIAGFAKLYAQMICAETSLVCPHALVSARGNSREAKKLISGQVYEGYNLHPSLAAMVYCVKPSQPSSFIGYFDRWDLSCPKKTKFSTELRDFCARSLLK